jgi:hypothetical protein
MIPSGFLPVIFAVTTKQLWGQRGRDNQLKGLLEAVEEDNLNQVGLKSGSSVSKRRTNRFHDGRFVTFCRETAYVSISRYPLHELSPPFFNPGHPPWA